MQLCDYMYMRYSCTANSPFPSCIDALMNVRAALVSTKSTAVLQSHSLNDLCGGLYATVRTTLEASLTNLKVSFMPLEQISVYGAVWGKDGKGAERCVQGAEKCVLCMGKGWQGSREVCTVYEERIAREQRSVYCVWRKDGK